MNVIDYADYMVLRCEKNRNPITNNHLNFMLHFLRTEFKRVFGKVIFNKSTCIGPYPSYHECYKRYLSFGALPIKKNFSSEEKEKLQQKMNTEMCENEVNFLNEFIDTYGQLSMEQLFHMYEDSKRLA